MKTHHLILATAALSSSLTLTALAQPVDTNKSQINIVFKQMNMPVDAKFKKFQANIQFDPSKPSAAKATLDVDIKSFDMGNAQYNAEVLKPTWFNAGKYNSAQFTSTQIKSLGANKLEISGKLTIKGKTADVRFPVSYKEEGSKRIFDGNVPIKRLTYNIGDGEWQDTSIVADDVMIKFHVTTEK